MKQREALTRERILRAALAIVDEEGLEALTMRRVGTALGVEAMSLYHHVPNKAALLDGVFEQLLAELPLPTKNDGWESALRAQARAFRAMLRAHPRALPLFASRPAVTTASLHHVERSLQLLRDAGFGQREAVETFQVLVAFVLGHSLLSWAPVPADEASSPKYHTLSATEFPRLRELPTLRGWSIDTEFEHGLETFLAGLVVRHTAKK